jgi:hypothetical protein
LIEVKDVLGEKRAEEARTAELAKMLDDCQASLVRTLKELTDFAEEAAKIGDFYDVRECLELVEMIQDLSGR